MDANKLVDTLTLPRAELAAFFLESLLFGAFSVLYFISIWILLYRDQHRRKRSKLSKWLFATATVMYLFSIAHMCLDIQRAFDGFIINGGTPTGTNDFYSRLDNPTHVAKSAIYIVQTLVGDSFVLYRLYVVWNRMNIIIVVPAFLFLGSIAAGFGICYELANLNGFSAIFDNNVAPWITSFFSLSLATNVLATLLIIIRIVWANNKVKNYRAGFSTYRSVVEIIVQSAAIYSVALVSLLASYVARSNAQYICLDAIQPLIGITFTLIIIRVGIDKATGDSSKGSHSLGADSRISAAPPIHISARQEHQIPMHPMAINVSVSTTHDRSSLDGFDKKNADLESDGVSTT